MFFTGSDAAIFVLSDDLVKSAVGLKKYKGVKYSTVAQTLSGLLPAGSAGINHSELGRIEVFI
jgi:hypothetical protein